MAEVDILLPYWGEFRLLKEAVESVLAQTAEDWHLMVFDDCYPSTEATNYFATMKDPRITYYRHRKNLGITKNFNYALQKSTADFCMMLGCDDVLLPNYLDRALANIGKADFYQPYVDVIDGEGKSYLPLGDKIKRMLRPKKPGIYNGEKLAVSLCRGNWLYFPSILWRGASIKRYGFDESYSVTQDVILEFRIIEDGGSLFIDSETTFKYRRFAESLSSKEKSKYGIRFTEENRAYDQFAKTFKDCGWWHASRAAKVRLTSRLHQLLPTKA